MVALPAVVDGIPLGSDGQPLKPWHEWDDAEGCPVGRDPRKVAAEEFAAWGIQDRPLLAVIRQNCIECAGNNQAEVRRCPAVECPMWPYRLGTNPLRRQVLSEEERQARVERGRRLAARRALTGQ